MYAKGKVNCNCKRSLRMTEMQRRINFNYAHSRVSDAKRLRVWEGFRKRMQTLQKCSPLDFRDRVEGLEFSSELKSASLLLRHSTLESSIYYVM